MPMTDPETDALADRILAASGAAASIQPVTQGQPDFGLAEAYRVAARIIERRVARGERPVGWKIGFTNRTIWDEYGVHAPIWGPIYDSTLRHIDPAGGPVPCPLDGLVEPRIEPEIAFRIAGPPHPDMDERDLLACIDAVAHGYEFVQSLYPAWRFQASDTVAAFALHGRYWCGPLVPVAPAERDDWLTRLSGFEVVLSRGGIEVDRGVAANVLGGPLSALRHFIRGLSENPLPIGVRLGDLVTTGTVTRAFPIARGERWSTEVLGLPMAGLDIRVV